jgi:adenine deaminase
MSLPVIPELKITDKGLFDTNRFDFVDVFADANTILK